MENTSETTVAESTKTTERSKYPVREFSYILNFCNKIYKELGHAEYNKGERIADVHGLKEDSIKQILSTCQQYGLLELKHGTGYKITNLFLRIEKYTSEAERNQGIIEAISSPELFKDLLDVSRVGHPVPSLKALANSFERKGLKENIANKTAEIFYENLKDNRLLNANNELVLANNNQEHTSIAVYEQLPNAQDTSQVTTQVISQTLTVTIPIPLKGSNIDAQLIVPRDYTSKHLRKIAKFVNALIDEEDEEDDNTKKGAEAP